MAPPKYALPEIERRWLVRSQDRPALAGLRRRDIEDQYLSGGRLRLRVVRSADAEPVFKLGKKYGRAGAGAEPATTLYLSEQEYLAVQALAGCVVRKARYSIAGGALDVYEDADPPLTIFEMEFDSQEAAAAFVPPGFVGEEVTLDARYSGFSIAQTSAVSSSWNNGLQNTESS